jgi:HD superfamily phosphohydrolase
MTAIRDPLHGYVKLDDLALDLIDTPQMQRLRWIKQLGLANLVYPGANHTRFEHSLGAFHLAGQLARQLSLDEDERAEVQAAALLHDVGHGPFSHATESVLALYLKQNHENVSDLLRRGEMREVLDDHGLESHRIQRLIRGETHLGQMINGEIDVDRMDYLVRDAHYTGVAYGVIDYQRLVEKMEIYRGQLVVEEGGVHAAESLLVSRMLMYPTVYFHHASRIAQAMMKSAVHHLIEDGVDPKELRRMDDVELVTTMTSAGGYSAEIMGRIRIRRLFKRAIYVGWESLESSSAIRGREDRITEEIAEEAGIDPLYVLVDNPRLPHIAEGNVAIRQGQEVGALRDVSPLAAIMEKGHLAAWRFGVYTPEEHRERVEKAARRCLNVGKYPVQYTFEDL